MFTYNAARNSYAICKTKDFKILYYVLLIVSNVILLAKCISISNETNFSGKIIFLISFNTLKKIKD